MTEVVVVLTVVSAVRGTWSPCGLSMLSTITPVSERARHHAFWRSALWFLLGAALGGMTLGGGMGLGSWLSHRAHVSVTTRILVAAAIAIVCLAADARIGGFRLPEHPRQVDVTWVTRFRPWAYAGGFGWQLGTGIATYLMTSAVYTVILVGIVWLAPWQALALGIVFGVSRGAAIFVGAAVTTPARLHAMHRWLEASDRASLAATMVVELCFIAGCLLQLDRGAAAVVGGVCMLALGAGCVAHVRSLPSGSRVGVS